MADHRDNTNEDPTQAGGVSMPDEERIIHQGRVLCCGACCDRMTKTRYTITTHSIEYERGLCFKRIDNINLLKATDIHYRACCGCNACSKITLYSNDTSFPELVMSGLPNSRKVYEELKQAILDIHNRARIEFSA